MSDLFDKIPSKFHDSKIKKIESGASKRYFYRLKHKNISYICMDSYYEKKSYKDYLKINSILSNLNVSIPQIYERYDKYYTLIMEDFGELRFDKIFSLYPIKDLLQYAVQNLVLFKNEIKISSQHKLKKYNFLSLKNEISELTDYYYIYSFGKKISEDLKKEFCHKWQKIYESIIFDFSNFVHKDYNSNNLMFINSRKKNLKCGILDFQSAFLGDCCWDLFSLLEDSRIYFNDQFNEYFIEYFYKNTNQNIDLEYFRNKYYTLNLARQTRLLGRWIKLYQDTNQIDYLNFIPITKKRMIKSLNNINNNDMKLFYKKYFKI